MSLLTRSQIDKIRGVVDRAGEFRPAANADEQAKTNDRLGNFKGGVDDDATDDTTGSTLPAGAVPNGIEVVVQAKHSNTSRIKVGLTASPTLELAAGQSATYRASDTEQIHIEATSDGDGVNFSHEVSA